jgi:hypothetical protein
MIREIVYNDFKDSVQINSVSDDIRFTECIKIFKTFETLEKLEEALTEEAKEKLSKTF